MGTDVNGKKILKELEKEKNDRKKVSLYLSGALYKRFVDSCDDNDASASKVMEKLMEQFLESIGGK